MSGCDSLRCHCATRVALEERLTNKEIGARLGIAAETVRKHAISVYSKLHVANRRQAAAKARALGYLPER